MVHLKTNTIGTRFKNPRKSTKGSKSMISFILRIFLFYSCIYGTLSIFIDNLFVRSIKDIILIILVLFSVIYTVAYIRYKVIYISLLMYISIVLLGSILMILGLNSFYSWMYGLKITFIPMGLLFLGVVLNKKNIKILNIKFLLLIFIVITLTWVVESVLGLTRLLDMGFVYGVNVKHFTLGILRLPSTVGTPDSYAFLVAILGILLESSKELSEKNKLKWVVKTITLVFLVLATIRSALIFWCVYQLCIIFKKIVNYQRVHALYLALIFICVPVSVISLFATGVVNKFLTLDSFKERLALWGDYVPSVTSIYGIIGYGIGTVGAASVKTKTLGLESNDSAVDNQYIAVYDQIGLIGSLLFYLIIILILLWMRRFPHSNVKIAVLGGSVSLLASSLFTNLLELYPFNLFFWLFTGYNIFEVINNGGKETSFLKTKNSG